MINTKIAGKFSIKKKIGSGRFSEIYLIKSNTDEDLATKIEPLSARSPQLKYEGKLLKLFQSGAGIPSYNSFHEERNYLFLVFDLLGPNLEELFQTCSQKFSIKTGLMLAEQMITRLEFIHSKSYIHRDVKPKNFAVGLGKRSSLVYLIDFGLAKKYRNPKTHEHIQQSEGKKQTGSVRFSSVNSLAGIEQSRRDDLISLAYMLIYFAKGSLPWQGIRLKKTEKIRAVREKKAQISAEELCSGLPEEFKVFLSYVSALRFEDSPDYGYLRRVFKGLFVNSRFEDDFLYDWSLMNYMGRKKVKKLEEEKKVIEEAKDKKKTEQVAEKKKKKTCILF